MLDEDPRMNSHESPSVRWFYLLKEGRMTSENDASRVSYRERGRPSFQTLLNARAPPRAFLFALVAQMPSTVRSARTPTDLNPNLIRVQKRDDERADRRESGQRVKEFQHMVTSDQIVGRPRTECAVASILPEPATAPVNWYTSVIVHIQRLKTYRDCTYRNDKARREAQRLLPLQ